jgi:hypothetical protein
LRFLIAGLRRWHPAGVCMRSWLCSFLKEEWPRILLLAPPQLTNPHTGRELIRNRPHPRPRRRPGRPPIAFDAARHPTHSHTSTSPQSNSARPLAPEAEHRIPLFDHQSSPTKPSRRRPNSEGGQLGQLGQNSKAAKKAKLANRLQPTPRQDSRPPPNRTPPPRSKSAPLPVYHTATRHPKSIFRKPPVEQNTVLRKSDAAHQRRPQTHPSQWGGPAFDINLSRPGDPTARNTIRGHPSNGHRRPATVASCTGVTAFTCCRRFDALSKEDRGKDRPCERPPAQIRP